MLLNPSVGLVDPAIQSVDGLDGHGRIHLHVHCAHTSEAGGDIQGDVITGTSAGHPGPCAVSKLRFAQATHRRLSFIGQTLVLKEDAHIAASLTFALGLT